MGGFHAENYKTNIRYNEDIIGKSAADKRFLQETDDKRNQTTLSLPVLRLNNTAGVMVLIKGGTDFF